jgi:excisionase family DNA binding protein
MAIKKRPQKPVPPPDAVVYKPSEVAALLRCDARTVYGMIDRGELPLIVVGRVLRIPGDPVRALLQGRKPPAREEKKPAARRPKTGKAGD